MSETGPDQARGPGVVGELAERRHWPKQVRSLETRRNVLEAAAELFEERGYERTTTHQIAMRARVSVGALYRYFADKEDILKVVYLHEISGLRSRVLTELSFVELVGKELRELVHKAVGLALELYGVRPGLRRVLAEQSRKIPALAQLRRAQEGDLHRTLTLLLRAYPGIQVADVEASAYLVRLFVESLAEDLVLYEGGGEGLHPDRALDGAVDMLIRSLLGVVS